MKKTKYLYKKIYLSINNFLKIRNYMLGGIIFVIVVWFIPLLVWYFVQGRQEFSKEASCVSSAKEVLNSKRAFYGAIIFGLVILASIIIFG